MRLPKKPLSLGRIYSHLLLRFLLWNQNLHRIPASLMTRRLIDKSSDDLPLRAIPAIRIDLLINRFNSDCNGCDHR
jgi:hypothetical protein